MIRPEGYMPSIIGREVVVFGLFLIVAVLAAACGGDGNGAAPPTAKLALFAGNLGGHGKSDGVREDARFFGPQSVPTDSDGNVYVADAFNFTIRKITPDGTVSTIAGLAEIPGSADGTGAVARFAYPSGMAFDSAGNLFVADCFNHTIRKITPDGEVSTLAGSAAMRGSADGAGAAARFWLPVDVATDSAGNVYVAIRTMTRSERSRPAGKSPLWLKPPGRLAALTAPAGMCASGIRAASPQTAPAMSMSPIGATTRSAGSTPRAR